MIPPPSSSRQPGLLVADVCRASYRTNPIHFLNVFLEFAGESRERVPPRRTVLDEGFALFIWFVDGAGPQDTESPFLFDIPATDSREPGSGVLLPPQNLAGAWNRSYRSMAQFEVRPGTDVSGHVLSVILACGLVAFHVLAQTKGHSGESGDVLVWTPH